MGYARTRVRATGGPGGHGRPVVRRVPCEVAEVELEGDYSSEVDGVIATCSRCGHETESFGTSDASVRRCLALLREECPRGEHNFYVDGDGDEVPAS